ncbi:Uncharacterised protein [Salmonella enterica subsp. enterica serovar Bovismorbificans]|nr:Uncharacterised protein [Salmonella enterica subsp. enterica serovar Bovismorbificans]
MFSERAKKKIVDLCLHHIWVLVITGCFIFWMTVISAVISIM